MSSSPITRTTTSHPKLIAHLSEKTPSSSELPTLDVQACSRCAIAIASGGNRHEMLPGIRVIILCREEALWTLMVVRRIDCQKRPYKRSSSAGRQPVTSHPLPALFLEVVSLPAPTDMIQIGLRQVQGDTQAGTRALVVYDTNLVFPQNSSPATLFLEFSWSFRPTPVNVLNMNWHPMLEEEPKIRTEDRPFAAFYRVHLSSPNPPSSSVSRSAILSPIALNYIRAELFFLDRRGWRSSLFAMGLTCKAWSTVLDGFFRAHVETALIPCESTESSPTASSILRSLENGQPERASLITAMSRKFFKPEPLDGSSEDRFLDLLSRTIDVEKIGIEINEGLDMQRLYHILPQLKYVEDFGISCDRKSTQHCGPPRVSDIWPILESWRYLRYLWVQMVSDHVRVRANSDSDFQAEDETVSNEKEDTFQPVHYLESLKMLSLCSGTIITGDVFLHMLPERSTPCLAHLRLHTVQGLQKHDLLQFLLKTRATLITLDLGHCTFEDSDNLDPHLFVLDEAIRSLDDLCEVKVIGCPGIISVDSLRAKQKRLPYSYLKFDAKTAVLDLEEVKSSLKDSLWDDMDIIATDEGDIVSLNIGKTEGIATATILREVRTDFF